MTNLKNISNFDASNLLDKNPITTYVTLNYYWLNHYKILAAANFLKILLG